MADEKRRFLTIEQVAEELNVKQTLVRSLLRTGELRGIQVGGRGLWRISTTDVEDYISQAYEEAGKRIEAGAFSQDADLDSPDHG